MREALRTGEDGRPGLVIFETCSNLIRTLPLLTYDTHNCEDVSDACEDHAPEALRYGLMSRPIPARIPCLRHVPAYDPFAPVTGPGNGGFRGL